MGSPTPFRLAVLLLASASCELGGEPSYESACLPPASPVLLSETCLYEDIATGRLASDALAFDVAYPLWSDGAGKRRWIRLPAGAQIDSSDPDHWQFPVGTQVWKEFSRDGIVLETRLIQKTSEDRYWMGAFRWSSDGRDAVFVPDGESNVHGTSHDVPDSESCKACHLGEPGRVLGFSAVQLSGSGPVTLSSLAAAGKLTDPPAASAFPAPGDPVTSEALGYLHGNCGHCHNPNGSAFLSRSPCARCGDGVDLILRLSTAARSPSATETHRTTVGVATQARPSHNLVRVDPGAPETSDILDRMRVRSGNSDAPGSFGAEQMPPLATEITDTRGIEVVTAWISSLR